MGQTVQTGKRTQTNGQTDKRTNRQTDGQKDGHYQVHYLPRFAVDNKVTSTKKYVPLESFFNLNLIFSLITVSSKGMKAMAIFVARCCLRPLQSTGGVYIRKVWLIRTSHTYLHLWVHLWDLKVNNFLNPHFLGSKTATHKQERHQKSNIFSSHNYSKLNISIYEFFKAMLKI